MADARSEHRSSRSKRLLTVTRQLRRSNRAPWYREYPPAPFLRVAGRWLDKAGFPIGQRVEVQVSSGRLVVTPIEEPTPSDPAER